MKNHLSVNSGCHLVAEYVDEGEVPANAAFHQGEVVRPQVVVNFLDVWGGNKSVSEEVIRTLLLVVQTETDGPSRAKIVESIARLQAVEAIREVLHPESDQLTLSSICRSIADIFTPQNK